MAQARDEWRASRGELSPEHLVFIDETSAATDIARRYGRCPRGQRLVSSVSWGHWKPRHSSPRYVSGRSPRQAIAANYESRRCAAMPLDISSRSTSVNANRERRRGGGRITRAVPTENMLSAALLRAHSRGCTACGTTALSKTDTGAGALSLTRSTKAPTSRNAGKKSANMGTKPARMVM